jgi:hypothetical protein
VLTVTDQYHQEAREAWTALRDGHERLETSNYILLETIALVGRRLGMQALREF